ncbi:CwfJ domain protein [Beauveria bassiana ARSEF 2860]|uniref:CwfJ domain protein n=1 Tax=Beauveria bassiana (strain ARSEF 2860) TaxID=655819 RepID=J4WG87_BEAB2|nr:CwfJ domain protein [Beauveria bassiana ARSEF 2860]EJP68940.1 CwfJ domain protein [Beauveria bassiana ARSEF 2860]
MAAPKIIVLGSLNGNLESAFKKLSALHAKNSFTLALLTGDVFGPSTPDSVLDALLSGSLPVPLPTYFSVGAAHPLPARIVAKLRADEDVCPNLHFLGRRSVTKTSDGLRIVSLGGALVDSLPPNDDNGNEDGAAGNNSKEQHVAFHTQDDARSLKGANGADILLTSTWPADIWKYSKVPLDDAHKSQVAAATASRCVAELCAALRPRYHLTASPGAFFYEREPFIQAAAAAAAGDANSDDVSVTRFISLAPYGNAAKQKALYAFTLNKAVDDAVPPGATASPLLSASRDKKRLRNDVDDGDASSYNRYGQHHDGRRQKRHRHHQQLPPPGPDQCFFCLSNPNTATHMHALTFPGHLLIIPLPHTPTLSSSSSSSSLASARHEMTRFRLSLQSMLSRRFSLGAITWEISRARNVHLVWQLVALPAALVTRGLAEAALRVEADAHNYPAFITKASTSKEDEDEAGDFVRVWLWAESDDDDAVHSKTLVMPLEAEARFDLQFVRRAVGKLLGLEARRVRWQDCAQTEEEETKDAEAFREAFKEWDFTLE